MPEKKKDITLLTDTVITNVFKQLPQQTHYITHIKTTYLQSLSHQNH